MVLLSEEDRIGEGRFWGSYEIKNWISLRQLRHAIEDRGSIQLDIENSIDYSIEFCSTVRHPVKLNGNLNRIFNRVCNIQLN